MKNNTLCVVISLLLLEILTLFNMGMANASEPQSLAIDRQSCGDYSIVSNDSIRSIFEKHCGTNSEGDQTVLLDAIKRLDPAKEAHSAAERDDYRLAALIWSGPPPPNKKRLWYILGVKCKELDDADVVIWHRESDVMYSATQAQLDGFMNRFAADYNAALLKEREFPAARSCELDKT